jgi:hypothetical protein
MKRRERKARRYSTLFRLIRNYIFDTLCIDTIRYEYTYVIIWILTFVYIVSIGFRIVNRSRFHILEIIVSLLILAALIFLGRRYGEKVTDAPEALEPVDTELQLTLEKDLTALLIQEGINITDPDEVETFIKQLIKDHETQTP